MKQLPPGKRAFFKPEYLAESVIDIDFDALFKKGIKAAFIDLDGTVVIRGTFNVSSKITTKLKLQPLDIYIATNRPKSRDLKNLKETLHAKGVIHPKGLVGKPFAQYYKNGLAEVKLAPNETIMIGDRYIQDIIGANLAGLHTLVVVKLDKPTNWFDKLLSALERSLTRLISGKYLPVK